jgi:glycerol-3-phosphate cytidylyltransferase
MVVGFTCGAFDLLHPGHVHLLNSAAKQCDYLIVGLHTNPTYDRPEKNNPIQSTFERYVQLDGLNAVDCIVPYDTEMDLLNLLSTMNINKRFLGSDYAFKTYTGDALCRERYIEIIFIPRLHTWSSSELRRRIKNG